MGRTFNDESVQQDIKNWPFKVVEENNKIYVKVCVKGETKLYYPEEISAMILEDLKKAAERYLEQKVNDAVITVPAYFNDAQRAATRTAAVIAGLNPLKIINEPTAAALAYGIQGNKRQKVLIFDFGGGTFDITIMDISGKNYTVIATKGDPHLGGEDIDQRLVDYFSKEFRHSFDTSQNKGMLIKLKKECEHVKRMLSNSVETTLNLDATHKTTISRVQFEELNYDLFERAINMVGDALKDAKLKKQDIDTILLVGGTTRIPKVREMLSNYFDGKSLQQTVNPDEAVAIGAAIQAALYTEERNNTNLKGIKLLDVCPLSLGVEVLDESLNVLIPRNTQVPVKKTRQYSTAEDNQTSIRISVFEGERHMAKDNHFLGEFILTGIPPAPRGMSKFDCSFEIDDSGILIVHAIERTTGSRNQIVITNKSRLSPTEAKKIAKRSEELRKENEMHQERLKALNKFEQKLYQAGRKTESFDGETRASFAQRISQFREWFNKNKGASKSMFEQKLTELEIFLDMY